MGDARGFRGRLAVIAYGLLATGAVGYCGYHFAFADPPLGVIAMESDRLVLATSSLHSALLPRREGDVRHGGLPLLSSALTEMRNPRRRTTLLLDAGNSLYVDTDQLISRMPEQLAALGYDAITLGHRDFEVLRDIEAAPEGVEVLVANVTGSFGAIETNAFRIFDVDGLQVAVIGVVDPEVPLNQSPEDVEGFDFESLNETVDHVQRLVDDLREEADRIVLLSSALRDTINAVLATRIRGVDAVLGMGGAATSTRATERGVPVVGARWGGAAVTVLGFSTLPTDGVAVAELAVNSTIFTPARGHHDYLRSYWNEKTLGSPPDRVLGTLGPEGAPLDVDDRIELGYPYWSMIETPMHRFLADAVFAEYDGWLQETGQERATPIDIILLNTGGVERGLEGGFVTESQLRGALPYNNKLVELSMTGEQIRTVLASPSVRLHGLLIPAGLSYTWDYTTGEVRDVSLLGPAGSRAPLGAGPFRVVTTDFVGGGGDRYFGDDQFAAFRDSVDRWDAEHDPTFPSILELTRRYLRRESPVVIGDGPRARFMR